MRDQAETLRQLRLRPQKLVERKHQRTPCRVISFTSGKGGVGKSSTVINTAISLSRLGKKVLILDADLGLANVDVMLGIQPKYTLQDLFEGTRSMEEIMVPGPEGITIIPAASGIESICNLDNARKMLLMQAVDNVACDFDYILIDTQAGIGADVIYFNTAASEIVCVITSEPTSLTDAYALIKVLATNHGEKQISVVANNVTDEREAQHSFRRLQQSVNRFLHVDLNFLGFIPSDRSLPDAIRAQRAVVDIFPSSQAGLSYARLARYMDTEFREFRVKGGMQFLFRQLLDMSTETTNQI